MKNNEVRLRGRIGKDVELIKTKAGVELVSTSIATSDYKKIGDEFEEITDWHNLVIWEKTAKRFSDIIKKGDAVEVFGKIKTRSFEDENGVKKYKTEIIVNDFIKIAKKENKNQEIEF